MPSHIINITSNLVEALDKLNQLSGKVMTLFVVDVDGKLCGTMTDGDIRRAILRGVTLDATVDSAMHKDFKCLTDNYDVSKLRQFRQLGIKLIPKLNADGTIAEIIDLSVCHTRLPLSAIVMAGGKGERLRPLTQNTPKPLLKIAGKPIIDYNIEALVRNGITNITVTVKYLAEQLREHFAKPIQGVQVKCVEEDQPLGTIGAAALADIPDDGYTIVMNSDLLTTISFEDMYLHHIAEGAEITIAAIPYQVSVPYAILTIADDDPTRVTALAEKPSYSYFANAGIYIIANHLLKALPTEQPTDAPDLIEAAIAQGLRTTYFPINGTWIDIGSPADFKQATELMKSLLGFK